MLSSELYHHGGSKKAIYYSENAHSLIEKSNNTEWMARVCRLLARQYRQVGLYERAKNIFLKDWLLQGRFLIFRKVMKQKDC